jgi:hypothetical protein
VHTGFWGGWRPDKRRRLERPRRRWEDKMNVIFRKWDGDAWAGLVWLRIGTGGGLL